MDFGYNCQHFHYTKTVFPYFLALNCSKICKYYTFLKSAHQDGSNDTHIASKKFSRKKIWLKFGSKNIKMPAGGPKS